MSKAVPYLPPFTATYRKPKKRTRRKTTVEEDAKGAFSNVSGKMGEILEFGTSITRFEYDEYGNRSVASFESNLFFRFKILTHDEILTGDEPNEVVTILVLPPEEAITENT